MKTQLHTFAALALWATALPAQVGDPAALLQRAKLIEKQEGDLHQAVQAYEGLLADSKASAVHSECALHLGTLLWRLDRKQEAQALLEQAVAAGGQLATDAQRVLKSESQQAQKAQGREQEAEALIQSITQLLRGHKADPKLSGAEEQKLQMLERELKWLGADGARALVRHVRVSTLVAKDEGLLRNQAPRLSRLVKLLWELGTEPAHTHLIKVADGSPLPMQRFFTRHASSQAPGSVAVFAKFSETKDPTGEIWHNVCRASSYLSFDDASTLAAAANPATQAVGWHVAASHWSQYSPEQRQAFFAKHENAFRSCLSSASPRYQNPAWGLMNRFLTHGPTDGAKLFLQFAHTAGDDTYIYTPPSTNSGLQRTKFPADDAWIAAAALAAKQFAKIEPNTSGGSNSHGAKPAVQHLMRLHLPQWTAAAVPDLITLFELGYMPTNHNWLPLCFEMATPSQHARMIRLMPEMRKIRELSGRLTNATPQPEWFPAIRDVVARCISDETVRWRGYRRDTKMGWSSEVYVLISVAGRTGHAEVVDWLTQLARVEELSGPCIEQLCQLASAGNKPSLVPLRAFVAKADDDTLKIKSQMRRTIYRTLTALGDVESIPALVAGYGHEWSRSHLSTKPNTVSERLSGLLQNTDFEPKPHAFGDDDLARFWRLLLNGDNSEQVWTDLVFNTKKNHKLVPNAAWPALAENMAKRWAKSATSRELGQGTAVLSALRRVSADDLRKTPVLHNAVRSLVAHANPTLGLTAYLALQQGAKLLFEEEARAAVRQCPEFRQLETVCSTVKLGKAEWRVLLNHPKSRTAAMRAIPNEEAAQLGEEIAKHLNHNYEVVRALACRTLGRGLDEDAVKLLLPMLRDSHEDVRKAARETLDDLRTAQQQRRFWDQAGRGVDTSPQAAATMLIGQAQPDQDRAQRLLAIRSLAMLGAPESLPYLIQWTNDEDSKVQAAASKAIADIHQKGAEAAPAKKK